MEPLYVLRDLPTMPVGAIPAFAVVAALVAFIVGESAAILLGLALAADDLIRHLGRRPGH